MWTVSLQRDDFIGVAGFILSLWVGSKVNTRSRCTCVVTHIPTHLLLLEQCAPCRQRGTMGSDCFFIVHLVRLSYSFYFVLCVYNVSVVI